MWLNNCVGSANYRAFAVTISSVAAMLGIVVGSLAYLLLDYWAESDALEERICMIFFLESLPKEVLLGVLIFMCVVNVPLLLLDTQLVLLHVFLTSQNFTTYEYIMRKQESKVQTLPRCMDWIVYAICGKKKKKKHKPDQLGFETAQTDVPENVGVSALESPEVNLELQAQSNYTRTDRLASSHTPNTRVSLQDSCNNDHASLGSDLQKVVEALSKSEAPRQSKLRL